MDFPIFSFPATVNQTKNSHFTWQSILNSCMEINATAPKFLTIAANAQNNKSAAPKTE